MKPILFVTENTELRHRVHGGISHRSCRYLRPPQTLTTDYTDFHGCRPGPYPCSSVLSVVKNGSAALLRAPCWRRSVCSVTPGLRKEFFA